MLKKLTFVLLALSLTAVFSASTLAAEAEDLIKYRKSVMKAIGGHMGAIAAIVQGKVDVNHLRGHAIGLNAASKGVRDIFPAESADGETEARMEIWQNPDEFKQAVMQFETAADGFLGAVDNGADVGAALKELGGSCKNCHDNFRQKKE
jgi:cytochrome c556